MIIEIKEYSEGGYYYDIYLGEPPREDIAIASDDGGLCTTTELNALDMAYQQARELLNKKTLCNCGRYPGFHETSIHNKRSK